MTIINDKIIDENVWDVWEFDLSFVIDSKSVNLIS